jgi:hypothetical protein
MQANPDKFQVLAVGKKTFDKNMKILKLLKMKVWNIVNLLDLSKYRPKHLSICSCCDAFLQIELIWMSKFKWQSISIPKSFTDGHPDFNVLTSVLESESNVLINWFKVNKMQANPDKFQVLAVGIINDWLAPLSLFFHEFQQNNQFLRTISNYPDLGRLRISLL